MVKKANDKKVSTVCKKGGQAMEKRVVVIFPFGGYEKGSKIERLFWRVIDTAQHVDNRPLVVIEKITLDRRGAATFLKNPRSQEVDYEVFWSVDTCQAWLAGWGKALGDASIDRVILLPGDIETVQNEPRFFAALDTFVMAALPEIVIGDFETEEPFSAKDLIDTYGTYSLLANWFPEVSRAIQKLPLRRPRSEFLNIDSRTLRNLLEYRKFAYEQTLNMLIRSWNHRNHKWDRNVNVIDLGTFHDEKSFRDYGGALDQIERTERMLRLLWRDIQKPKEGGTEKEYREFYDEYDRLDQVSTSIRGSARVTIRNLLGT